MSYSDKTDTTDLEGKLDDALWALEVIASAEYPVVTGNHAVDAMQYARKELNKINQI